MSVLDVFAQWLLEKIDKKFLQKKEFTVEERVQELHQHLNDLLDICKGLNIRLGVYTNKKTPLWALKNIEDIEYEVIGIKKCVKTGKLFVKEISKHIQQLQFFFDKDGFHELADMIVPSANIFVHIGNAERLLSELKLALDADDEDRVRHMHGELSKWIDELTKMETWIEATIQTLLAFANKIKE